MMHSDVKEEYNSLQDVHLAHHFQRPVVFRHLLCMGLVTPEGKVVSEREWSNYQRFASSSQSKYRISRLRSLASEGNLRKPVAKFPDDKRRVLSNEDRVSPFPFFPKRKGIVGEPYLDSIKPGIYSNRFKIQSAGGSKITKCSQVWERLFPPPSRCSILCWRQTPTSSPVVRLKYMKKIKNVDIMIYQQPSGVSSRCIYSGSVSYREEFEFTSCRKDQAAFSLAIYESRICIGRVSTCCEYRYAPGKRIGGPSGHLLIVNIQGGNPCPRCTKTIPMTIKSPKIYHNNSTDSKITINIELEASETDITNNTINNSNKYQKNEVQNTTNSDDENNLSDSADSDTFESDSSGSESTQAKIDDKSDGSNSNSDKNESEQNSESSKNDSEQSSGTTSGRRSSVDDNK